MNFEAIEISQPLDIPKGIALDPVALAANSGQTEQWMRLNGDLVVRNVRLARLLPYPAEAGTAKKNESIIIAPGGGMMVLAMDHEGISLARKFAAMGYDAYVLQYRLNATPPDNTSFRAHCSQFYAQLLSDGFGNAQTQLQVDEAVSDLKLALQAVQKRNTDENHKIHFLGFSAGSFVGREFILQHSQDNALFSIGMLYGDLTEMTVQAQTLPHLFAALANDDPLFSRKGVAIMDTWHAHHQDVELHFFRNGGHGFGDRVQNQTSDAWLGLYVQWLKNIVAKPQVNS